MCHLCASSIELGVPHGRLSLLQLLSQFYLFSKTQVKGCLSLSFVHLANNLLSTGYVPGTVQAPGRSERDIGPALTELTVESKGQTLLR